MDKKRKKTFISYVFLLALMVITVNLVLKSLDISMLSNVIEMVNKEYLLAGVIAILVYILLVFHFRFQSYPFALPLVTYFVFCDRYILFFRFKLYKI